MTQLKKGSVLLELQYEHHSDSINAELFEAITKDKHTIIYFSLKPVGSNQKDDEENLHEQPLEAIVFDDEQLLSNLELHLKNNQTTSMEIKIRSQGKLLSYSVKFGAAAMGRLPLLVQQNAG